MIFLGDWNTCRQPHQGVAVGWVEADTIFQYFLHQETGVLRIHGCATAKDTTNARFPEIQFFGECLQQFGRGEHGTDLTVFENSDSLIHDVIHVASGNIELLLCNDLFDETRIQVDEVA